MNNTVDVWTVAPKKNSSLQRCSAVTPTKYRRFGWA